MVGSLYPLVSQSVSRKDGFRGSTACMHIVVRGRDVLVAEQVTDADEIAGTLGELGREAVPKVVRADLGGTLRLEARVEGGFPQRVAAVELREGSHLGRGTSSEASKSGHHSASLFSEHPKRKLPRGV